MISLLDIAERTQTGEKVEDKAWDMGLFQTISELVKNMTSNSRETLVSSTPTMAWSRGPSRRT